MDPTTQAQKAYYFIISVCSTVGPLVVQEKVSTRDNRHVTSIKKEKDEDAIDSTMAERTLIGRMKYLG